MPKPICAVCSKQLAKYGAKHCKSHVPVSPKTREKYHQRMLGNQYAKGKNLGNTHGFKKGQVPWNKGMHNTWLTGENNPNWKGSKVNYRDLHKWVAYWRGTPKLCEHCGEDNPNRRYHWANKSGKYLRDLSDWIRLCVPCHKRYDKKNKNNR